MIARAYDVAERAHEGQLRKSGEPYITHPLAVAAILAGLSLDDVTIAAALLHDAVEDTGVTLDDLERDFGPVVASIVDGVTGVLVERICEAGCYRMAIEMGRDRRETFVGVSGP